eukprot:scaffold225_cov388-Prasinococcus_capsulatus_cf.AAC.17
MPPGSAAPPCTLAAPPRTAPALRAPSPYGRACPRTPGAPSRTAGSLGAPSALGGASPPPPSPGPLPRAAALACTGM